MTSTIGQYDGLVKEQIKAVCIQIVHKRSAADILPRIMITTW